MAAGAGPLRTDPADIGGDTDNGLGVWWNWNKRADGQHTGRALVDDVEVAHSTFTVPTLGEEFKRGLSGEYALVDFPTAGQTVTGEWRQALLNFTITGVE